MRMAWQGVMLGAALICGGALSAQTNPSDFTYGMRYDAGRRVVGTIAPDPDQGGSLRYQAVRNSYDAAGRLVRVETGQLQDWQADGVAPANWPGFGVLAQVETGYDAMGRKVVERRLNGSGTTTYAVTQWSYDDQGLLACTAVRMNTGAFGSLPASACSLGTEGSDGPDRITRNEYDAAGQLTKVVRAYGTSVQQDYARYTYSANGKRTSVTDANGKLSQLTYDGFDRQAGWIFPSKTNVGQVDGNDYEAYDYDSNGNRTSVRKRDGRTLTFTYDALNRMTSKIVPDGCAPIQVGTCTPGWATRDVYYGYDLRGLQTYARFDGASGEGVTQGYDGFGGLVSTTTTLGGQSRTLGFAYDADGARTSMSWPDGQYVRFFHDQLGRINYTDINASTPLYLPIYDPIGSVQSLYRWSGSWSVPTGYHYDWFGRLVGIDHHLPGSANVASTFGYNPAGQIISETRNNDAYAFTGRYAVDRSYAVNGQNQYTSAGPASFQYDGNGNLVSDGTTGYLYDAENRLIAASNGAMLQYDPLGRLWQTSGGPSGTTQFVYDGDQLTVEYDGAGNMLRRYVHGGSDDDPLVWYEGAGTTSPRYLYANHQGSIDAVMDGSGASFAIDAYDEYGITKNSTKGAIAPYGRFSYTGQAGCPNSACTITRPASTPPPSADSSRPIPSDTTTKKWMR